MTKEEFTRRWASDERKDFLSFTEVADCAAEWDLDPTVRERIAKLYAASYLTARERVIKAVFDAAGIQEPQAKQNASGQEAIKHMCIGREARRGGERGTRYLLDRHWGLFERDHGGEVWTATYYVGMFDSNNWELL